MTERLVYDDESKSGRGPEFLFYGVTLVLFFFLRYGLSFSAPFSLFLAIVIDFLAAYPLFIRGKTNKWRNDKGPWTLVTWLIPTIIVATGFYIAYWILQPFYPW
jgi:hypothetical protein